MGGGSEARESSLPDRERISVSTDQGEDRIVEPTKAEAVSPPSAASAAQASKIGLEEFIEAATRAALRAVESHSAAGHKVEVSPQPPPGQAAAPSASPGNIWRIIIGLILGQQ
jgi:hypothetical protein